MAFTISRVDKRQRTYDVSDTLGGTVSGVSVALLPVRDAPTAATVWTSVTFTAGEASVVWAGPDADSTSAIVVPATADLWIKGTDAPYVQAVFVERITVRDSSGTVPALPGTVVASINGKTGTVTLTAADLGVTGGSGSGAVSSVNTKTGAVVLSASDVGADASGAATAVQAYAVQRANHTGTQSADTVTDGTTNKAYTATERSKLTGIATGATANSADATLLARANHTGTQAASTVTGLATVATSGAYTDLSGKPSIAQMLTPSGDTSGSTDSAAIQASLTANGDTFLGPGQWYVGGLGMTVNNRRLRGSGPATVLNVIGGSTGLTLTGPGDVAVSDLQMVGGAYGIVVNGAYDADFRKLWFTGQTSGAVKINGDLATEQHWTDIVMRGVGGVAFDLTRTTTIYTGSVYLDRVRSVEPAAGATYGFRFRSTAGSASLNIAFMTQCVADNYTGTACLVENCAQVFVSQCWFAINGTAPAGSAALRITGGFQQSYLGCYTYSGRTDAASPSVKIDGNANGVNLGGGHVFDGTPTTVALGVAGAKVGGFSLDDYQTYCGGGLLDVPLALPARPAALPGTTNVHGEETFSRMFCNNNVQLASGTLVLSYFTATKTELISTIEAQVGSAKSGGTYCGYGLYTVATDGTLTLVAKAEQTTSPTLWNSGFQPVGGFDTKLGLSATYQKVAGQRYAVGALFVGTTGPQLIGNLQSNGTPQSSLAITGTTLGPLSGVKAGQSTLGTIGTTTHTAASLSGSGITPWFLLN